jgi:hypothetical protein
MDDYSEAPPETLDDARRHSMPIFRDRTIVRIIVAIALTIAVLCGVAYWFSGIALVSWIVHYVPPSIIHGPTYGK